MFLLQVALVGTLCLYGLDSAHSAHPPNDFQCFNCDDHAHKYPHCEPHMCHGDEFCMMNNKRFTLESRCVKEHECRPDMKNAKCSLASSYPCEMCCSDELCVSRHFSELIQSYLTTSMPSTLAPIQATSTTTAASQHTLTTASQHTLTTASQHTLTNPYLQGKCADELIETRCMDTKEITCKDPEGISLCAETCGLCGLLRERFGSNGTCRDQVVADECTSHKTICSTVMGEIACPFTCNKCDSVLKSLYDKVSRMDQSTVVKPPGTTSAVSKAALTDATTTTGPCFDNHDNCIALDDPCHNILAPQICKKFCNLCCKYVEDVITGQGL